MHVLGYHRVGVGKGTVDADSVNHLLPGCARWESQYHSLAAGVGADLLLSSVVRTMLESNRFWAAMVSFCKPERVKEGRRYQ